jgi:hypothetical protein
MFRHLNLEKNKIKWVGGGGGQMSYSSPRDVMLPMNVNGELPFTISPILLLHWNNQCRIYCHYLIFANCNTTILQLQKLSGTYNFDNLTRLERLFGMGPWKEFPWSLLEIHRYLVSKVIPKLVPHDKCNCAIETDDAGRYAMSCTSQKQWMTSLLLMLRKQFEKK